MEADPNFKVLANRTSPQFIVNGRRPKCQFLLGSQGSETLDMTYDGLGNMIECDFADTCDKKFPLISMGCQADGPACADPGTRTPISMSRNLKLNCLKFEGITVWYQSQLHRNTSSEAMFIFWPDNIHMINNLYFVYISHDQFILV